LVKHEAELIEALPEKIMTSNFIRKLVIMHYNVFSYIDKKFITNELCKLLIETHGKVEYYTLMFIPEHMRSTEICKLALSMVSDNKALMEYIPSSFEQNISIEQN